MSKYSSYKEHQLITENWRKFINEGDTPEEGEALAEEMSIKPELRKSIAAAIKAGKSFEEFVEEPGGCGEASEETWKAECFGYQRAWNYVSRELQGLPGSEPLKKRSREDIAAMKKIDRDIAGRSGRGPNLGRGGGPSQHLPKTGKWRSSNFKGPMKHQTDRGLAEE